MASDEPAEKAGAVNTVLVRVNVLEHSVQKCMVFDQDDLVWSAKMNLLSKLPKDIVNGINCGFYIPPANGRAGKFLVEERLLSDYHLKDSAALDFKFKSRDYKGKKFDDKQLHKVNSKSNQAKLMEAVYKLATDKVASLLRKGLDPNFCLDGNGETPLTAAAAVHPSKPVILALVEGGAHLDFRNATGASCIHAAARADNHEAIKTLLDLGASADYRDVKGLTALYYTTVGSGSSADTCFVLLREQAQLCVADCNGWQEIHQACRYGHLRHLEHLIYYGADINAQNSNGSTALHVCALHDQIECCRTLLFRGAKKAIANKAMHTAQQDALLAGNTAIAELIQNYDQQKAVPVKEKPTYNTARRPPNTALIPRSSSPRTGPSQHVLLDKAAKSLLATSSSPQPTKQTTIFQTRQGSLDSLDEHSADSSSSMSASSRQTYNSDGEQSPMLRHDITTPQLSVFPQPISGTGAKFEAPSTMTVTVNPPGSPRTGSHHSTVSKGPGVRPTGSLPTANGRLRTDSDAGQTSSKTNPGPISSADSSRGHERLHRAEEEKICRVLVDYTPKLPNELQLTKGEVVQVLYHGKAGMWEGISHGKRGWFPSNAVKDIPHTVDGSTSSSAKDEESYGQKQGVSGRSHTQRTIILVKAFDGLGFSLRGLKGATGEARTNFKPTPDEPALQYVGDVDPGSVAEKAGLRKGDFIMEVNGQEVVDAPHSQVVRLIKQAPKIVTFVVTRPRGSGSTSGSPPSSLTSSPAIIRRGSAPSSPANRRNTKQRVVFQDEVFRNSALLRSIETPPTPPIAPKAPKSVTVDLQTTKGTQPSSTTAKAMSGLTSEKSAASKETPVVDGKSSQCSDGMKPVHNNMSNTTAQSSTKTLRSSVNESGVSSTVLRSTIDAVALPLKGNQTSAAPKKVTSAIQRSTIDAIAPFLTNPSSTNSSKSTETRHVGVPQPTDRQTKTAAKPTTLELSTKVRQPAHNQALQQHPIPSPRQHRRRQLGEGTSKAVANSTTADQKTKPGQQKEDPRLTSLASPQWKKDQQGNVDKPPQEQPLQKPRQQRQQEPPLVVSTFPAFGTRLADEDDDGYARIKPKGKAPGKTENTEGSMVAHGKSGYASVKETKAAERRLKAVSSTDDAGYAWIKDLKLPDKKDGCGEEEKAAVNDQKEVATLTEITCTSDAPYASVQKAKKTKQLKKTNALEQDDAKPPKLPPRSSESDDAKIKLELHANATMNQGNTSPKESEIPELPPPLPELSKEEQQANAQKIAEARRQHHMRRSHSPLVSGSSAMMVGAGARRKAEDERRVSWSSSRSPSPGSSPATKRSNRCSPETSPSVGRKRSASDGATFHNIPKRMDKSPVHVDNPLAMIVAKAAARNERVARGESKSLADKENTSDKQDKPTESGADNGEVPGFWRQRAKSDGHIMREPPPRQSPKQCRPSSESFDGMPDSVAVRQQKPSKSSEPLLQMILSARGLSEDSTQSSLAGESTSGSTPPDGSTRINLAGSFDSDNVFFEEGSRRSLHSVSSLSDLVGASLWDSLPSSSSLFDKPTLEGSSSELLLSPAPAMFADNDITAPEPPSDWLDDSAHLHHSTLAKRPSTIEEEDEEEQVGQLPASFAKGKSQDNLAPKEKRLSWLVSTFVPPPPVELDDEVDGSTEAVLPPGEFQSEHLADEDEEAIPPPVLPSDDEEAGEESTATSQSQQNPADSSLQSPSLLQKANDDLGGRSMKVNSPRGSPSFSVPPPPASSLPRTPPLKVVQPQEKPLEESSPPLLETTPPPPPLSFGTHEQQCDGPELLPILPDPDSFSLPTDEPPELPNEPPPLPTSEPPELPSSEPPKLPLIEPSKLSGSEPPVLPTSDPPQLPVSPPALFSHDSTDDATDQISLLVEKTSTTKVFEQQSDEDDCLATLDAVVSELDLSAGPGQLHLDGFKSKPLDSWNTTDVAAWLTELGLDQYKDSFLDNEISGSHLTEMTKDDLRELGIARLGHRLTIINALTKLTS